MFSFNGFFSLFNDQLKDGKLRKELVDLETASIAQDCAKLKSLIDDGVNVNVALELGNATPLFWAIEVENTHMLSLLLSEGRANPNMHRPGDSSMSPLSYALTKKNYSLIALLLLNGADYNFKNVFPSDKKEKYRLQSSKFVCFYESFTNLLARQKDVSKEAKQSKNHDLYNAIADEYEKFLTCYRHEFEEEHKKLLSLSKTEYQPEYARENHTIKAFEAKIEEYRQLGKKCMDSTSHVQSKNRFSTFDYVDTGIKSRRIKANHSSNPAHQKENFALSTKDTENFVLHVYG